jgi:predicted RNase H-like HicB family nuclease
VTHGATTPHRPISFSEQPDGTEETGGKHSVKMTKPGWWPITLAEAWRRRLYARPDRGDTPRDMPERGRRAVSTTEAGTVYTVRIHHERDQEHPLWAEVKELPGCFASGRDMDELREALSEAVSQYLSEPGRPVRVELEVTEQRMIARSA